MKKIAVITPLFNQELFIADCITSVSKSITLDTFIFEHIIIEDASTDNSREVVANINLPNVKVIYNDKNYGPSISRNMAIDITDADYIFALDGDDVIFQNSLRYLFESLESSQSTWVYGDFLRCDEHLSYKIGNDYYGWNFNTIEDVLKAMYSGKHFFQQNAMYTKEAFNKVGKFREDAFLFEDFDLATRLLLTGYMPHYIPITIHLHRYHDHNLSNIFLEDVNKHKKNTLILFNTYEKQLREIFSKDSLAQVTDYLYSK